MCISYDFCVGCDHLNERYPSGVGKNGREESVEKAMLKEYGNKGRDAALGVIIHQGEISAGKTARHALRGRRRALVMDDELLIRLTLERMLEVCGYEPFLAKKGEEAVESFMKAKDTDGPFDVVILDLRIPNGMGGGETIRKLLEIDPDTRAIIMSGSVDDPAVVNYSDYGFRYALPKPFTFEELKVALEQVAQGEHAEITLMPV